MATRASRSGELIAELWDERGWNYDRVRLEILKHPDLGADYLLCESTLYRAERGYPLSRRSRFAIATVLGKQPRDIWPSSVRKTPRRTVGAHA